MRSYRTPLLKRFPNIPPSGRLSLILRRLGVFLPSLTILVVWVILLRMRIFPDRGLGWLFYWLHDNVYLTGKGVLFNRPFPYSIAGWLLGLGVLTVAAGSFLFDRSFILRPHRYLLEWVFNNTIPFGEYLILRGTSWLRQLGFQSNLLRRALMYDWVMACDQLLRSDPGKRQDNSCRKLARLTNWMVQIEAGFIEIERYKLLSYWHWAYVLIRAKAAHPKIASQISRNSVYESAAKQLLDTLDVVFRDFQHQDMSWLEQTLLEDELFSIEALGRDLCRLLYPILLAAHPNQEPLTLPFERFHKTLSEKQQKALLAQVVYSIDKRRFFLHASASKIERALLNPTANSKLQFLNLLPASPDVWQLALSVALHAALDTQIYRLGTAFFEAQDTAVFAISLMYSQYSVISNGWARLVSTFPQQEHYLAASFLRWLGMNPEEEAFYRLVGWDKNLIDSSDFTLSLIGLHSLRNAGGPTGPVWSRNNED